MLIYALKIPVLQLYVSGPMLGGLNLDREKTGKYLPDSIPVMDGILDVEVRLALVIFFVLFR